MRARKENVIGDDKEIEASISTTWTYLTSCLPCVVLVLGSMDDKREGDMDEASKRRSKVLRANLIFERTKNKSLRI